MFYPFFSITVQSSRDQYGGQINNKNRYYNATTQIEITPLLGATANQSACANVQNKKFTSEFTSFLAITERGPYNIGSNPVNTLLTLWQPDANLSSLSQTVWDNPSLELYLESAP